MDSATLKTEIEKLQRENFSDCEAFFDVTSPKIKSLLALATGDKDLADSLIDKVYDDIYANINSLKDAGQFYKWAGLIAIDEALNNIKDLEEDKLEEVDLVFEKATDDAAGIKPERIIKEDEFIRQVEEKIGEMRELNRIIALYFYYGGLSISEISEKIGKGESDIKGTVAKIRMDLLPVVNRSNAENDAKEEALKGDLVKKGSSTKLLLAVVIAVVIIGGIAAFCMS